ncbi:MAG TPA: hypothetical protein VE954_36765 [Oligoflexus sp.]|uniref:hypothetical protein n=1 Tax=Oligoflexus sp. TaxID=1971216 RepID=UPI002D650963|nr:hypothetical protein [Oligoflexus sp.]HYX38690.1 hypothetical protein [Oligoflexus sp.]
MKLVAVLAFLSIASSIGCRSEIEGESADSSLQALFVESSVASLSFALDGNNLYLAEGTKVLPWGHNAPTVDGQQIKYKGLIIGRLDTGFFCNGKFETVCDVNVYKNKPSVIAIKYVNPAAQSTKAPAAGAQITYVTANTAAISNVKLGTAIQGIAKGSCTVNTSAGPKTMSITAVAKKTKDAAGKEVQMVEVSTPVYKYSNQGELQIVEMKQVQNVFANGTTKTIAPSAKGKNEGSAFMALFN